MPAENRVAEGLRRISWAERGMPVLRAIGNRLESEGNLAGLRIGIALVLEPKTANLALMLQRIGAEVTVYCPGHSTTASTAEALRAAGVTVFADPDADEEGDLQLARRFLSTAPQILIDDGASLIRLMHAEFPDLLAGLLGAAEETTSGVRPLRQMLDAGALQIPVIAVNDARTKYLFDNVYGTGQSCVMALLDLTNIQLAGRVVAIVGYGWVGKGVAMHAAALGARVVVSELDPIRALQALHDGHRVASLGDSASEAEIVFAATGIEGVVTPEHVEALPSGAILCTAGGGAFELPMAYLNGLGTATAVRNAVVEYDLPRGTKVMVVSEGESLNCADAEGNPIEVMDLSLSLQALAAEQIALVAKDWSPGVYPVSAALEETVARLRLDHEGATLETLTPELSAAMRRW